MTNSEAVKALREEFSDVSGSKIRRSFDRAKRAGLTAAEAYKRVRKAGKNGAFGPWVVRISQSNPTAHEAELQARNAIDERCGYGHINGALLERA